MATPGLENIREWRGQDVVDRNDQKIGKLDDVYYDKLSDVPLFAGVRTGPLGRKLTFIPLAGAQLGRDRVQVRSQKEDVKNAPSIDPEAELSEAEEASLFAYFGMEHTDSEAASGRRLVRH
jgi:uncharacterized protein YrrD